MDEIIARAKEVNKDINVPTISTLKEANAFIEEFIKKNERIIYGGTAIKALIGVKEREAGGTEGDFGLIDYDFYSPEYLKDSVALCNELNDAGYKYVRRVNALHPNTLRVNVDFSKEFLADISYVPPEIYARIPKIKIENGKGEPLWYADADWLKMDLYNQHKNPYMEVNRWLKVALRLAKLEKYYPLYEKKKNSIKEEKGKKLIDAKLAAYLKKKDEHGLIALGELAYCLAMKKNLKLDKLEFMTLSAKDDIKGVIDALKLKEWRTEEYYPFMDILPKRVEIVSPEMEQVIALYQMPRDYCLAEVFSAEGIRMSDFYFIMRWLYTKYNLERIGEGNEERLGYWAALIKSLGEEQKKNKTFEVYKTDCVARKGADPTLSPTFLKSFYEIPVLPSYRPAKKMVSVDDLPDIHQNDFKLLGAKLEPNTMRLDFEDSTLKKLLN